MESHSTAPDELFTSLISTAVHPTKRRNLTTIQEICSKEYGNGRRNFELRDIAKLIEAASSIKVKTLWNPQSIDYRRLIEAWQTHAGPPVKSVRESKPLPMDALLAGIPDPATRIVVQQLRRERDKLRSELNIVKSYSSLLIDKRPRPVESRVVHSPSNSSVTVEVHESPSLNRQEREALEHAISEQLWNSEGWIEEELGRVSKLLDGGGTRRLFKPGFASAIRRILGGKASNR